MKFREELQEFVHKAQRFLQSSDGGYGQRGGYYGMRDNGNQGGGYNQGGGNSGGSYGQRESWMHGQQNYPQNGQGWGGGNPLQNMDPRWFM